MHAQPISRLFGAHDPFLLAPVAPSSVDRLTARAGHLGHGLIFSSGNGSDSTDDLPPAVKELLVRPCMDCPWRINSVAEPPHARVGISSEMGEWGVCGGQINYPEFPHSRIGICPEIGMHFCG